ncbi:MAG: hypothetical protein ACI4D9_12285 [Lachnospiraceae bacterium]
MKKAKKQSITATVCVASLAAVNVLCPVNVLAADSANGKDEVVYANLDESGDVSDVHVVNSFTDQDIVDYGDYENVRNLTTTDEIQYENGKVTLHTDAEKIYYQGDVKEAEIPWNIEIRYYLDGKECEAQHLAGKSGAFKMHISVTQNKNCDSSYWKGYALQATLTLDSNLCKNIVANDATIANVGSDKQLSYIIMPDEGADLTITADVKDFEMDAFSINAMKLNLNVDIDSEELEDKISDIQKAIEELNDGATELDDGAKDMKDGAKELYSGSKELHQGTGDLDEGVKSLNEGIKTMQKALKALDSNSSNINEGSEQMLSALKTMQKSFDNASVDAKQIEQLTKASAQIKAGINDLTNGLSYMSNQANGYRSSLPNKDAYLGSHDSAIGGLNALKDTEGMTEEQKTVIDATIELLKNDKKFIAGNYEFTDQICGQLDGSKENTVMAGALELQKNYKEFDDTIQALSETLSSLAEEMKNLKAGVNLLTKNYESLNSGIKSYTEAVSQITTGYEGICQGALSVADGTSKLYKGTGSMVDGALELYDGSKDMKDGTEEMASGTQEFYDETKDMDTEITDELDKKIDEMTGKDIEVKSFTSEKNKNVDSVLFVMKTPEISVPEEEEVVETEKKATVMDKIKDLFR